LERYRLQEWLSFIGTELHKMFSPWLFHPEFGAEAQAVARGRIAGRLGDLDRHLAEASFLMSGTFTVADAYCFTVVGWSGRFGIDVGAWPHLAGYMGRIAKRPKVREAMAAHGVLQVAE